MYHYLKQNLDPAEQIDPRRCIGNDLYLSFLSIIISNVADVFEYKLFATTRKVGFRDADLTRAAKEELEHGRVHDLFHTILGSNDLLIEPVRKAMNQLLSIVPIWLLWPYILVNEAYFNIVARESQKVLGAHYRDHTRPFQFMFIWHLNEEVGHSHIFMRHPFTVLGSSRLSLFFAYLVFVLAFGAFVGGFLALFVARGHYYLSDIPTIIGRTLKTFGRLLQLIMRKDRHSIMTREAERKAAELAYYEQFAH